jgi:hypothetical protein
MKSITHINRSAFMEFFRDDERLNELTPDDRIEIFRTVLLGQADFTKELLEEVLSDYSVSHLKVIELENTSKRNNYL